MSALALLLATLLGCGSDPAGPRPDVPAGGDTACDRAWYPDGDGDGFGDAGRGAASGCEAPAGYVSADGDCDDADASVFPGAPEVCDWRDQDCDDLADDGAIDAATWSRDADGDGFGAAAGPTVTACQAPGGYVAEASDCDDADAEIRPDAYERCDGVDQDCDGAVDEDAADADTFYVDADGDGWGDRAAPVYGCEAPPGAVDNAGDCDDADPLTAPDLPERCGGGDEDCDATVDEDDAVDAPTWHADLDGDGFGAAGTSVATCEAPAAYVSDATDCDDADATVFPGAPERCGGGDEDCDGTVDENTAVDAPRWFRDGDADGFGDPAKDAVACLAPAGHVADATDCDDADASVFPGAPERCGGGDEDCDGTVDEDDAADAPAWHADLDGDGFGDETDAHAACSAPAGRVANAADCDDADPDVYPGAKEWCGGGDEDCDGAVDEGEAADALLWYRDADVDGRGDPDNVLYACTWTYGYVEGAGDCDDTNPRAHEDLPELCATPFDDDCDGVVNEPGAPDAADYRPDADRDGYGDAASGATGCATTEHVAPNDDDCDDADPAVNPDADEVCGGGDEDCDGRVDESDAIDRLPLYRDVDGDGYGGAATSSRGCTAPVGYALVDGDCDDADATVNPEGVEDCGTAADDDCDGATDDAACVPWYRDVDGDGYGGAADSICACGPSEEYPDATGADCDDGDPAIHPGASEIWGSPVDAACDGAPVAGRLADNGVGLYGTAAHGVSGRAVASAGDQDGDGLVDLFVGGGPSPGAAYVVHGAPTVGASLGASALVLTGEGTATSAGAAVGAGDLDGDGLPDLLVAADGSYSHATVYLLPGPRTGEIGLDAAPTRIASSLGAPLTGWQGFVGDLDGDGRDEVAVSAPTASGSESYAGLVSVFSAPAEGTWTASDGAVFTGPRGSGRAGHSLAGLGDVDGDGLDDFAVGAPSAGGGVVYVVLGLPTASDLGTAAEHVLDGGGATSTRVGGAVRGAGDVDGDGLADLLVGAPGTLDGDARAYLFTTLGSGGAAGLATTTFTGGRASFGTEVDAGDLDGDGRIDVVIAWPGTSSLAGEVYVLLDPPSGTVADDDADVVLRGSAGGFVGEARSLAVVGDADGDGKDDLLVGERYDDTTAYNAGVAWFVRGR